MPLVRQVSICLMIAVTRILPFAAVPLEGDRERGKPFERYHNAAGLAERVSRAALAEADALRLGGSRYLVSVRALESGPVADARRHRRQYAADAGPRPV